MLWLKAFHIVFMVTWFAGLFYLPRIFVNLASVPADSHAERERLLLMARRLYGFSNLLSFPAVILGLVLWLHYGIGKGPGQYWLHAKIALVVAAITRSRAILIARTFATHERALFRVFNEARAALRGDRHPGLLKLLDAAEEAARLQQRGAARLASSSRVVSRPRSFPAGGCRRRPLETSGSLAALVDRFTWAPLFATCRSVSCFSALVPGPNRRRLRRGSPGARRGALVLRSRR